MNVLGMEFLMKFSSFSLTMDNKKMKFLLTLRRPPGIKEAERDNAIAVLEVRLKELERLGLKNAIIYLEKAVVYLKYSLINR